jgi:hypothetical protein
MSISDPIEKWPRWACQKYLEGSIAFARGRAITDNPDPSDSEFGFFWDWGYTDAETYDETSSFRLGIIIVIVGVVTSITLAALVVCLLQL